MENALDCSMYEVSVDNTVPEIISADWYGAVQEGFQLENLLPDICTDEEFVVRFHEVYNTFTVSDMIEDFDEYDLRTQVCIVGIADLYNFSLDGKTTFKDMFNEKGVDVEGHLLQKFYVKYGGLPLAEF